jgi:hypothetical protein
LPLIIFISSLLCALSSLTFCYLYVEGGRVSPQNVASSFVVFMEGIGSPGSSSSSSIEVDPPIEDDLPIEVDPHIEEVAPIEEVPHAQPALPIHFVPIINLDLPLGDFLQALVDARA